MSDHDNPTISAGGPSPPALWVCAFAHGDGIELWACDTGDLAYRELARACRGYWREAREVDRHRCHDADNPRLPVQPPVSDRATVELYFAAMRLAMPAEHFTIAAHELIADAPRGGRR